MKALEYRLPADGHAPDSAWGRYVAMLFDRWVAGADIHGRADYVEVCNEPNLQLWPQRGPRRHRTSTAASRSRAAR